MTEYSRRSVLRMGALGAGALAVPVAAGRASAAASTGVRWVPVDGVIDVRDIGGYTAARGRTVLWQRLYRSAALNTVTPQGLQDLAALNLRTVVDLRSAVEVADGPDLLPAGARLVLEPVDNDAVLLPADLPIDDPQVDPTALVEYENYVSEPAARASFGAALRLMASPADLPLLYHCNGGANRTGWETAVLLRLLGVSNADIYADYLLSNVAWGGTYVFSEYLDAAFAQADAQFGSFAGYVTRGLGVDVPSIVRLRQNLLTR